MQRGQHRLWLQVKPGEADVIGVAKPDSFACDGRRVHNAFTDMEGPVTGGVPSRCGLARLCDFLGKLVLSGKR